jgi:AraC-like DNA-binding protein
VTSPGLLAFDLGCRGAAAGLFLMVAGVLLRDRPGNARVRLRAALAAAAAAFAIRSAPGFPADWRLWSLPLLALSWSAPPLFWLWARAMFDDDFEFAPRHAIAWAAFVACGLVLNLGLAPWPGSGAALGRALSLAILVLVLLAAGQTLATWRADLIAGRRRLRAAVFFGAMAYCAASAIADLAPPAGGAEAGSALGAVGLLSLAILSGWGLFRAAPPDSRAASAAEAAPVAGIAERRRAVDPALLRRLERLMTVERAYRREGLTIGALAAALGLPEYRLRRLINEGLGHGNFNAFLNRYRIDEARAALADPAQREVPVLTIAMDAGFQSIGPFNRAFKTDTGLTPTEFRRRALAAAEAAKPLETKDDFEIGKSA